MGLVERSGEIWRDLERSGGQVGQVQTDPNFRKRCVCATSSHEFQLASLDIPRFHDLWHIFEPDSCVLYSFFPWDKLENTRKVDQCWYHGVSPRPETVNDESGEATPGWFVERRAWPVMTSPRRFSSAVYHLFVEVEVVGFIDSAYVIIRYLYMCVYHCLFISLINLLHVFSHKVVSWLKFSWTHGFTVVEAGRFRVSNTRIPSRDSQQGGPSFKLLLNPNKDP